MIIVDVTATADDNVLSHQHYEAAYRKEQLRRLQEEVIEMEDVKAGVSITDLGLNDFRMDLVNQTKLNKNFNQLPNGDAHCCPCSSRDWFTCWRDFYAKKSQSRNQYQSTQSFASLLSGLCRREWANYQ
jgi:hypothetical protein